LSPTTDTQKYFLFSSLSSFLSLLFIIFIVAAIIFLKAIGVKEEKGAGRGDGRRTFIIIIIAGGLIAIASPFYQFFPNYIFGRLLLLVVNIAVGEKF
jgi:hypothetical protein